VELSPVVARDSGDIERAVTSLARSPNGGLIVVGSALEAFQSDFIVMLAARNRLPAVYPFRYFVIGGGLISYGPDSTDQYRRALAMLIASSRARSRPTYRSKRQPSTSW
jgi:putative tryptophan/tyrosine transport system substrate-binding protein